MRPEGFSCSLYVLYEGLGISKFKFLIKRYKKHFSAVFCFHFLVIETLDPDPVPDPDSLEMLGLDPDPYSMNPDPQHCYYHLVIWKPCKNSFKNSDLRRNKFQDDVKLSLQNLKIPEINWGL